MKPQPPSLVPVLAQQCAWAKLPVPECEVQFHPTRKWRADLLWREPKKLIVEVEGGVWLKTGSRHTRGAGFEADAVKYAEATILGFHVMRVTPRHVKDGTALGFIERFFRAEPSGGSITGGSQA